jgi:hypothetical protein
VLSVGVSQVSLFVFSSTLVFAIPLSVKSHVAVRLARLSAVAGLARFAFFAT